MGIAVQVRPEQDALVGHFAQRIETENLETSGIGKNGARPGHELVQTAEPFNSFVPRAAGTGDMCWRE